MLTTTLTKSVVGVGALLTVGLLVAVGDGAHALYAEAPSNYESVSETAVKSNQHPDQSESKKTIAPADDVWTKLVGARQQSRRRKASGIERRQIRDVLKETTEIEFVDTSLQDAIEFLADLHEITIILDEATLLKQGVKSDVAVTTTLSGVRLQTALNAIVEPLGATYVVKNGVVVVTAVAKESGGAKARGSLDLSERSVAEEKIENALTQPTQFEFIDTSLKDAMEFLSDQHKIRILLSESELAEAGIAPDEPITAVMKDISLQSGLNIILKPLGLTYLIEDDVLKITTAKVEQQRKETRIYAVNSLLKAGFDAAALQRVVENQGEAKADIVGDAGVLVVTASQGAHRKVLKLLEQLERAVEVQGVE